MRRTDHAGAARTSSPGARGFDALNVLFMAVVLFLCVYPLYYMLIYSLSDPAESAKGIVLLPRGLTLVNYQRLLSSANIGRGFFVSAARTVAGTALTLFGSSALAYILTKPNLPFRKGAYRLLVITMYLNAGLIPWYMTMVTYGLRNTFLLYVLPGAVSAFSVVLIRTYIQEAIPPSIGEAATIDGAGLVPTYTRIILPLSVPILAAIAVFSAVSQWNSWTDNLFLVSTPRLKTLQLILYEYLTSSIPVGGRTENIGAQMSQYRPTADSLRMTISIITIIPIFLVYPFLQKYFVKGLMVGAIKG